MAAMHAAFWDAGPECEVVPTSHRYLDLPPWLAATEAELGTDALVPRLVLAGEKAFGGYDEEWAWWEARAVQVAALL